MKQTQYEIYLSTIIFLKKNSEYRVVKILRKIIDNLMLNVTPWKLFPLPPTIHFKSNKNICPNCHKKLKVQKTLPGKKVSTLEIGGFIAHETVYHCVSCGRVFHSQELHSLLPDNCNFGYDVIVFVGKNLFLQCHNQGKIVCDLNKKNITISKSEVGYLARKFIIYLALLHKKVQKKTRAFMNMNGGYILHLDGTCEGGSPHLISVLDGITEIVLDNIKIVSENSDDLIPFLERIKKAYGDPVVIVSDMGKGIALAIKIVFKNIPVLICHYHFLKDLGKDLFGEENDVIRKRLRKHGIQAVLKKRLHNLKKTISGIPHLIDGFFNGIENENIFTNIPLSNIPLIATYTLINWALAGKNSGQGFGFPFDRPYLVFYQRLQIIKSKLHQLYEIKLRDNFKDNKVYSKIGHDLMSILNDPVLKKTASKMEDKVVIFDKLRTAMRITLPENRRGLNDNGDLSNIKTIEKEVKIFRARLLKNKEYSKNKDYHKMIEQINKYWVKLFSDPIIVETKVGKMIIQPQRTNNILEQFFRNLMRSYRKRNGFNAMEKVIKTMLSDTPLVMNLKNKDYIDILLNGKQTLKERFAEIDSKNVCDEINKSTSKTEMLSPKIKKLIKNTDLPESLVSFIIKKAS